MKKNKIFLIALSLLASISFAQQQVKYGLGFEFHTLPTAFMMENNTSQMGIYFPMETASGLLIEPKLTYSNSSTETDYDSYYNGYNSYDSDTKLTINNWSLVVGLFKLSEKERMRFYAGLRVGKSWYTREENDTDDIENDTFILAPTIGTEYFITDNFTFGGEGMYLMVSEEDEQDEYTTTSKISILIPSFIVRFYF